MKRLTSAANPQYKSLLKLAHTARERGLLQRTFLDGVHLVQACRDFYLQPELIVTSDEGMSNPEIEAILKMSRAVPLIVLDNRLFKQLSPMATPTGILAVIAIPVPPPSKLNRSCVFLEAIQDGGNLGSILRSAAAADVKDIFLSPRSVDVWSPRVLRAAMGAHFLLNIYEDSDLLAVARAFNGTVWAISQHAKQALFDADLRGAIAFVFGNEGSGLSAKWVEVANATLAIPMAKGTESLNIAAAAAICLFERMRQNR